MEHLEEITLDRNKCRQDGSSSELYNESKNFWGKDLTIMEISRNVTETGVQEVSEMTMLPENNEF